MMLILPYSLVILKQVPAQQKYRFGYGNLLPYSLVLLKRAWRAFKSYTREKGTSILSSSTQTKKPFCLLAILVLDFHTL